MPPPVDKFSLVHQPTRDILEAFMPLVPYSDEVITSIREHGREYERNNNSNFPRRQSVVISSLFPGQPDVTLYIFTPSSQSINQLCPLLYKIHGGGHILGTATSESALLQQLADSHNTVVITPEYRLAPENPFPADLQDAYSGLVWASRHAAELGADASRLAIQGESGGGGLAAALCILARERPEQIPIKLQVLIFSMLDYETGLGLPHKPNSPTTGGVVWGAQQNVYAWKSYRGFIPANSSASSSSTGESADLQEYVPKPIRPEDLGLNSGDPQLDYEIAFACFSPSHLRDASNLPQAFIAVGSVDLFFNECVEYCVKLNTAGSPAELHVYPGAPHAFMMVVSPLSDQFCIDIDRCYSTKL